MTNAIRCSVLLAAYCGEAYLAAQINSILPQLGEKDELLISDDSPEDRPGTRALAEAYAARDPRIKILRGPGQGVIRNVEFLLTQGAGEYLLLSDQDDIWLPGKLEKLCEALAGGALLAMHDATLTDARLRPRPGTLLARRKPGVLRNLLRNGYTGCCMALRRELLLDALPFPKGIPMHDQWLGLLAECRGEVAWLPEPLLLHRRHDDALTAGSGSLAQKLRWRTGLAWALARRCARRQ